MRKFNIDFNKTLKPVVIAYATLFIIGIICSIIFGVKLDINFSGGTKISYSFEGEIQPDDAKKAIEEKGPGQDILLDDGKILLRTGWLSIRYGFGFFEKYPYLAESIRKQPLSFRNKTFILWQLITKIVALFK